MAQELLDVGTGKVYRRAGAGWQQGISKIFGLVKKAGDMS